MNSTKEQLKSIGKRGVIRIGVVEFDVVVKDYKNSYGRNRWLVSPVSGKGELWTEQNPLA